MKHRLVFPAQEKQQGGDPGLGGGNLTLLGEGAFFNHFLLYESSVDIHLSSILRVHFISKGNSLLSCLGLTPIIILFPSGRHFIPRLQILTGPQESIKRTSRQYISILLL